MPEDSNDEVPDSLQGCESLLGQDLLFIDDYPEYVERYIVPRLILVTRRRIALLPYQDEGLDTFCGIVARKISGNAYRLILVDHQLGREGHVRLICGTDMVRLEIQHYGISTPFCGCSTNPSASIRQEYLDAGAVGSLYKDFSDADKFARELAQLFASLKQGQKES